MILDYGTESESYYSATFLKFMNEVCINLELFPQFDVPFYKACDRN